MNSEEIKTLWQNSLTLSAADAVETEPLPWSWQQKLDDFIKPGDFVLDLNETGESLSTISDDSVNVLLSRDIPCDLTEAHRVLKKHGFFLYERTGADDNRALAEFLLPGSRPADSLNLENELPKMQAAGFRVMFRSQAYPIVKLTSFAALPAYIAEHPAQFTSFSADSCLPRLLTLHNDIVSRGFVPTREHKFILIGKKR